jgi:hypothetical protein
VQIKYPRLHLAIDNCFAVKRWVRPRDWMEAVREIENISLIQASTDNEIDPTHNTEDFRNEWIAEVQAYEKKLGVKVISLYSGYAEYRTVGIGSHSKSKRDTMISRYFEPTVDIAACLDAQVGNTLGAFSAPVLEDPEEYKKTELYIEEALVRMAQYADRKKVIFGYEQMYTPTQGMWTIDGCEVCMQKVTSRASAPMYITIDTAHQVAQHFYRRPTQNDIAYMHATGDISKFRLPEEILKRIRKGEAVNDMLLDKYDYWFAALEDSDVYQWLERLGCYSPIIHLQQTDGTYSAHKPFTEKYNKDGIVNPKDVLRAIKNSYDIPAKCGMPPKVEDIYLAFELFFNVSDSSEYILSQLRESVAFWRKEIPQDGIALNLLV